MLLLQTEWIADNNNRRGSSASASEIYKRRKITVANSKCRKFSVCLCMHELVQNITTLISTRVAEHMTSTQTAELSYIDKHLRYMFE
jgi:hypothetical protein